MTAPLVAVVIPYFQRQEGVLRRALASVAAQQGCPGPVEVLVVDDDSPAPASPEVDAVTWPNQMRVKVIPRVNAGPGAARNTGLNSATEGTRFIAFLDSDDEWSNDHLARAVAALERGYDFFFADLMQLGAAVSAFRRAGRITPADHAALQGMSEVYAYQGDFFDQTLTGNVVGTPTVVIARERLGSVRFRTEFTTAGEDYLFWMEAARLGARVVFSAQTEAVYGRGVNVFAGSGWGTEGHLKRVQDEIAFKKYILRSFRLTVPQIESTERSLDGLRLGFAREVLRRLRQNLGFPKGLISKHLKMDPRSFLELPRHAIAIALNRGREGEHG